MDNKTHGVKFLYQPDGHGEWHDVVVYADGFNRGTASNIRVVQEYSVRTAEDAKKKSRNLLEMYNAKYTTWRKLISEDMKNNNDGWENVVSTTLSNEELDEEFYAGSGSTCGYPFTLWTKDFVYFPVEHDGMEWVGSVPRNPNDVATEHQGSG